MGRVKKVLVKNINGTHFLTVSSEFFFLYWQACESRVEEANIQERRAGAREGEGGWEESSCFLCSTSAPPSFDIEYFPEPPHLEK